ncbi:Hypothetical protein KVN_LOCUS464 [uncultured virus]|nr:Hypothetical protein KVN_LOCUS464 [uncultured virus]
MNSLKSQKQNSNDESLNNISFSESYKDENIENEAENLQISKEFQEMVIKYVKIDDYIRKKKNDIKELTNQKKPCEKFIIDYLEKMDENVIQITDGKLRKNKCQTKGALNQQIIKNAINEKIKDPLTVESILKIMENLRPKSTRINLKRTSIRDKKKNPIKNKEIKSS